MTKKLIASLVLIVLVAGAFVSSSLYINSLNKGYYEQITQADINDLKARIASALKPLWESQGLDSTILLELADEIDMSLEASPYKSGLLHSSGTLTLKFNAQHASSVLYIDAQFSNLPFGTSVFSLSSPDSQALFSEGKIGVIELSGTTLALRLSDLQIDRDNWRGGKDTIALRGISRTASRSLRPSFSITLALRVMSVSLTPIAIFATTSELDGMIHIASIRELPEAIH